MSGKVPDWKPAGTAIPAESRDDDSDERPGTGTTKTLREGPMLGRLGRWIGGIMSSEDFNVQTAQWKSNQAERRFLLLLAISPFVLHWVFGLLPCQCSAKVGYLEQRVDQLETENKAVEAERDKARGIWPVEDNSKLPGGNP